MKYSEIIIKCKNADEFVGLQKYLFKLYSWRDNGLKHHHIKNFGGIRKQKLKKLKNG